MPYLLKQKPYPRTEYALTITHNISNLTPYLLPIYNTLQQSLTTVRTQVAPIVLPHVNKALVLAQDSPGIISVGILILLLLIVLQIVNIVRRIMMFWVRLLTRILFWGGIALVIAVVWQRGLSRSANDLLNFGQEISDVWWGEYRRWEGYQNRGKQKQQQFAGYSKAGSSWR
jgi:hypothetical protein